MGSGHLSQRGNVSGKIGGGRLSDSDFVDQVRRKISYNPSRVVWQAQHIPIYHHPEDVKWHLTGVWEELKYKAALNVINSIDDGELYSIQVQPFCRGPIWQMEDFLRSICPPKTDMQDAPPNDIIGMEITLGYQGALAQVERLRYQVMELPSLSYTMPTYRPPTWKEIKYGLTTRLKDDIAIPAILQFLLVYILARILFLPQYNPKHWGYSEDSKGRK